MQPNTSEPIPTIDLALVFDNHVCRVCGEHEKGLWVTEPPVLEAVSFVCIHCIARKCQEIIRGKSGALARYRLMKRAEEKGSAWDGNYEIVYLHDPTPRFPQYEHRFDFYYRGKVVTMYTPGLDSIVHTENEHAGTPRTKTLQIVNENAIDLWKRNREQL